MGSGIYILSNSIDGVEDFTVTVSNFLKDKVSLKEVFFHVLHIGDLERNLDIPWINAKIKEKCGTDVSPSIYSLHIDGQSGVEAIAKTCNEIISNGPDNHAIFVDLVSRPAIMAGVCNRLCEGLKCDGHNPINRVIFYTYRRYLSGDGCTYDFGEDNDANAEWLCRRLWHVLGLEG